LYQISQEKSTITAVTWTTLVIDVNRIVVGHLVSPRSLIIK
jgi:hypothetical protein